MSLDESRALSTEYLLDASSRQFDCWGHNLLIFSCSCARTIIVRVTTFELAHLLKSIITQATWTLLCVRVCSGSCAHCRIILSNRGSIWSLILASWVCLCCRLLTRHASRSSLIHRLNPVIKPRIEHLARLFWAMAPALMLAHLYLSLCLCIVWFLYWLSYWMNSEFLSGVFHCLKSRIVI